MASIVAARNGVASVWSGETAPNARLRVSQLRDNDTRITSSRQLRLLAARRSIYAARALFVCFYCCETIYRCRRVNSHVKCLRKNYYFYPPGRNSNRPERPPMQANNGRTVAFLHSCKPLRSRQSPRRVVEVDASCFVSTDEFSEGPS